MCLLRFLVADRVADDRVDLRDQVGNRFTHLRYLAHLELEQDKRSWCRLAHFARKRSNLFNEGVLKSLIGGNQGMEREGDSR